MKNLSVANRWNLDLIEENYAAWLEEPDALDSMWRAFFEGFELASSNGHGSATASAEAAPTSDEDPIIQGKVIGAIYAFRSIGHTQGHYNPLAPEPMPNPRLSLQRLGFDGVDLSRPFHTGNYLGGVTMPIQELLDRLKRTYCGTIGCEYIHIQETPKRRWLQARMEPRCNEPQFARDEKIRILRKIMEAESFERFLHTRYAGQKRFSLEGGETFIAALDSLIQKCPSLGVEEIVMGMAHRGRLNVLANIFGKSYDFIFREFSENYIPESIHGDGDVKYHLGFESKTSTESGAEVELRLAANPSHLEAVNPVVQGKARARQRMRDDTERRRVMAITVHGDAAFAGQGVVMETLNLSKLKGYRTGGTIHLIINNQIGFTTDPRDARSSRYCTDIAKMIEVPIFHVNGDDPLAVCMVAQMALEYRQEFQDDVVIDMYCYRKHGHNESDEPAFTQPDLYKRIAEHDAISRTLIQQMVAEGDLTEEEAEKLDDEYEQALDTAFERVKDEQHNGNGSGEKRKIESSAGRLQPPFSFDPVDTSVPAGQLSEVAHYLTEVPEKFQINRKIGRQLKQKRQNFEDGEKIDWAFAESLAFGSLLAEGIPVRLTGQDSERGTFSQRHSAWYDVETRARYVPLMHIADHQARFCVYNSSLSEAAILGFDFGYSLDYPRMLSLWEAQFGDFCNGAQVHIDQFLSSSESKWGRISDLVLLLPHGYEGQGPEHSSARLERWLQLCAEENMQVAMMTDPAQYFHILRRQMKREFRKPLIIMAPKSLLRHKECVSEVSELTSGRFHEILDDVEAPKRPKRVILCSGKVYYDLMQYRAANEISDAAIVRVEQLYPLHTERLREVLDNYRAKEIVWCQEEPKNMGAWTHMMPYLYDLSGQMPLYSGRQAAASPAPGSLAIHKIEQEALVETAFLIKR